jgi:hypothetical protein
MGSMRRLSLRSSSNHKRDQNISQSEEISDIARPRISTAATTVSHFPSDFSNDTTPRPPSRILKRRSLEKSMLPPIEFQPSSPSRRLNDFPTSQSHPNPEHTGIDSILVPLCPSSSEPNASIRSAGPSSSPQQSTSLGRTAHPPKDTGDADIVLRRNSLGDLKIPARISQAQIGLRKNLGMVRDFAASVDREPFILIGFAHSYPLIPMT